MNGQDLVAERGVPDSFRIELRESSGPVSPRYQYTLHIVIESLKGESRVQYENRGEFHHGVPTRDIHIDTALGIEAGRELWSTLMAHQVLELAVDIVGEERRKRVGVSLNTFELRVGDLPTVRFEYLQSLLDDPDPALAGQRAVIEAVKRVAEASG